MGGLPSDSMSNTGPNETLGLRLVLPLFRARGESGGRAFQRVPLSPRAAVRRSYDGVDGGVALESVGARSGKPTILHLP